MAKNWRRQEALIRQPFAGLDRSVSTEDLPEKGSTVARVHFEQGWATKKPGRTAVGNTDSVPLNGRITQLYDFKKLDSTERVLAFTPTSVYSYSQNVTGWTNITGSASLRNDEVSCTTYVNKVYFANHTGGEDIYYWDGLESTVTALGAGYKGKVLVNFGERLVLLNTWEGDAWQGQRMRWSNVGNTTFTAGDFVDLVSFLGDDEIIGAALLQTSLIIYGKQHILECSYTGSTTLPFAFTLRDSRVGLSNAKALFATKSTHYFLSAEGIFQFDLSLSAKAIDNKTRDWFLDNSNRNMWTGTVLVGDQRTEQLVLYYTNTSGTNNDRILCMDMRDGVWTEDSRSGTCACFAGSTGQLTIDELSGTIDSLTGDLAHLGMATNVMRTFVGDANGVVWWDFYGTNLGASAVVLDYETKDFSFDDDGGTCWMGVEFLAKGDTVTVSYSTDEGSSWTSLTTTTLTSSWLRYRLDFESIGKTFRLRFYNAVLGESVYLRWFRPYFLRTSSGGTLPT